MGSPHSPSPEAFPERIFKPPQERRQSHGFRSKVASVVGKAAKSRKALKMNVEIDGLDNIPEGGSFILAGDHHSAYDAFLDAIMLEDGVFMERGRGEREIYFVVKSEIWEYGPGSILGRALQPVIERLGAAPVKRDGGGTDRFIEDFSWLLNHPRSEDGVIEIAYPGGTRVPTGSTRQIRTGVTRLSRETGTPVVPVGHANTDLIARQIFNPFKRTDVGIKIGEPIHPSRFEGPDAVSDQNQYMLAAIKGLSRQAGELVG